MNLGLQIRATPSLNIVTLLKGVASRTGSYGSRYGTFKTTRVNPSGLDAQGLALKVFTTATLPYSLFRGALYTTESGGALLVDADPVSVSAVASAWAAVLTERIAAE